MKKNMFKVCSAALIMCLAASCSQEDEATSSDIKTVVGIAETPEQVNGNAAARGVVVEDGDNFTLYWAAGEAIGVYGSSLTNSKYTSTNSSNAETTTFKGGSFFRTPKYAYYPYSSDNSSNAQTAVRGSLAQVQTWNASSPALGGDYKIGTYKSRSWSSYTFTFSNVMTYLKLAVDATGTVLEGDKLQSVTLTANSAEGEARQLWGAFSMDLTQSAASALTWDGTEEGLNTATLQWTETPALTTAVNGYMAAAPMVKQGDVMAFEIVTDNHKATFNVTSGTNYSANLQVTYNLTLAGMSDVVYMTADGEVIGGDDTTTEEGEGEGEGETTTPEEGEGEGETTTPEEGETTTPEEGEDEDVEIEVTPDEEEGTDTETPVEPEVPVLPEPQVTTGTFTCATYNVDGLPQKISFISLNSDGPGSSGTSSISAKIAGQGWDFVGFSEDFAYHSELTGSLGDYTWGTYRGSISSSALFSTIDTDGLGFASRNATCSWSEENITKFTSSYGGLTSGANTCIKKGFRHYPVTVADGVIVDVIITHMNTYSSSGSSHINAQHAQLKQIAEYINTLVAQNNRPVILMGDTNCRYTRHDFATYFWGVLDSGLTYADPWVDFQWNGVYPTYPSNSLMVSDATGTSDSDIICADTQQGEVVDKIIYINPSGSSVQLKANSYLRDYDNFNGLADHMPIVVEFTYVKTE